MQLYGSRTQDVGKSSFNGKPHSLMNGAYKPMMSRFFNYIALAVILTSCSTLHEKPSAPDLSITKSWPTDVSFKDSGGVSAKDLQWRGYFVDSQLTSLIDSALTNNRDLRLALLRVQESRASYGIQRAELFPSISLGAQAARSRLPGDLNPTGRPLVAGDYEAYVGLNTWELDLWGRVRSLKDAALQEYLATEAAQRATRISLISEVANAYLRLRELDERIALANETIATREESARIFRRRNEVGSVSRLELSQVETLLLQARSLGAQLQQARATQAHALSQLVGLPIEISPMSNTRLRDDAVFAPLRVGLPSDLLVVRPDIAAAEYRLKSRQANIRAARAAFFPRIALVGSFGTASSELDGLFDHGSRAWSFVPTISLPIYDTRRRQANLDLAQVRSNMAIAEYERTIQVAFREVSDALASKKWLSEQVAIQRQSLETQSVRARLAQLRYDNGAATYLEVLDAQRELLEAQQQLVQMRRNLLSSHIALYTALGGGAIDDPINGQNDRVTTSTP